MFSKTWKTSQRKYGIVVEHDVKIRLNDGIEINTDIFHPDSCEKFPAIFGFHPYRQAIQTAPLKPDAVSVANFKNPGQERGRGYIEAGDPNFFVRRGYAQVIANVRGTGKSSGTYPFIGPPEAQDAVEVLQWVANQPWCDGNIGMFGVSYFSWIQQFIASLEPPHLKCIFAPWGATDLYRDAVYRGGILGHTFWRGWTRESLHNARPGSYSRTKWGDKKFKEAIAKLLQNEDIASVPELIDILKHPEESTNPIMVDILLNPLDGPFWEDRRVKYGTIRVPAYIGNCWGVYAFHLPGAFRGWENLNVPKRMIIGPPTYLDRPLYQLHYEALRWFDYWLKGIDTGIMNEAPIRLFVMGTNQWKEADEWPLPETKWTPFYLHENGLLSEHEHWPNEGSDSFEDSPWYRGFIEYCSPRLVEDTEIIGPIVVNLFASTTDTDVHWIVSFRYVDCEGNERVLTRGWLKGSHREVDPKRSKPWFPFHPHSKLEPLTSGHIYEFNIPVVPTGCLFRAGSRFKLRISSSDDQSTNALEVTAGGNLLRQSPSRITVYHDAEHPSHILLPITKGNILETFISGGIPF